MLYQLSYFRFFFVLGDLFAGKFRPAIFRNQWEKMD